ncbi:MAG: protein translocase subunit SecD [Candidatus Omnitrophota bacterium]
MNKQIRFKLVFILAVVIFFSWFAFPLDKRINLGLDLKGGMHLVLRVDTTNLSEDAKKDAVERAKEIIENRINEFGVGEPSIQRQGQDQIIVQLPGITDRQRAVDLIGRTAHLEFKLVSDDIEMIQQALDGNVPEGYELKPVEAEGKQEQILLEKDAAITGEYIVSAQVEFDQSGFGEPYVSLKFNSEGAKKFSDITKNNIGRPLAIVLDGNIHSAPTIRDHIPTGKAQISGRFDFQEASDLAIVLRVGALPAPMYIEEERTVGPLLGRDSIRSGILACVIGGAMVLVFMFLYYLMAGLIANVALVLNLIIILGSLGFLRVLLPQQEVTLTLPGIAGIVLTLGMAVDANVLVNERIREELKAGRSVFGAINNGYHKAFRTILDANVTTLIAAFLLFQFGTGPIRGFAVTLSIGLIASMFTAIFVTRAIFEASLSIKKFKSIPMFDLIKDKKINFISKRRICYALSALVICIGMFVFFSKGKSAYGIDFAGGQIQEYRFQKAIPAESLRASLSEVGLADSSIQSFRDNPEVVVIRTSEDTALTVGKVFKDKFPDNKFEILRIEKVGPVVGQLLRKRAILAILYALAGILLYVGFRFKHFNFAIAGIIALLHDVLLTVGILAMTGRQIDLLIVTALLTIAGYSINDTIVIYDRVRENLKMNHKMSLEEIINLSINRTLSRTLLTTLLTLFVVVALFLFGGEVLNAFAFSLIIGFVSGVYSTIFIASPLVLAWQKNK